MAKLVFDANGQRFYETGVSKCILFVKNGNTYNKGVAWNGITTISESPEGAEETALYADDIKYLSLRSVEEYKGSISAYMYPDEFLACDGCEELCDGLIASQQPRKAFAIVYQTKKGNDNGEMHNILHIVYNCTVSPTSVDHATVNESPEAAEMSWDFTTIVETANINGVEMKIAHLKVDMSKYTETAAKARLNALLDTLYGTDPSGEASEGTDPTLVLPEGVYTALKGE